jgi:hypothetical protein
MKITSNSSAGHDKNLQNFGALIAVCSSYGDEFNPSNENIFMQRLNGKQSESTAITESLQRAKVIVNNTTNHRESVFNGAKKFSTRIIASLESSGASAQTIEDARTWHRKIQGVRKVKIKEDATKKIEQVSSETPASGPVTHSVSQQSYDAIVDHFKKLIGILSAEPMYRPNEEDLKIEALTNMVNSMENANSGAIATIASYNSILYERNRIFYDPQMGLVVRAREVKKYVKSIYGTQSPKYKQIADITFTNYST